MADDDGSRGPSINDMDGTASSSSNSLSTEKNWGDKKQERKSENYSQFYSTVCNQQDKIIMQLAETITEAECH